MTTNDEARAAKRRAMERLSLADHLTAISASTTQFPASVSIGTTGDPPPVVYRYFTEYMYQDHRGGFRFHCDGGGWWCYHDLQWARWNDSDVPQSVKDALTIRPALALDVTAGNVNRPAIRIEEGTDEDGRYRITHYVDGESQFVRLGPLAAFTPAEVERAKAHGSERYAVQALLCDEARLAKADREYERIMGPIWGYTTQGDIDGEVSECTRRDSAEIAAARWETRRNFKRPFPGETPGDWARRNGVSAPWADRYAWEARVRAEMDAVARGEPVT